MTDLVEALRLEGDRRVCEKEMTFGNSKSREDRIADDLCHQAASRISQQDAELERVRRELEEAEKKFETADKLRVFWNDKATELAGKTAEARKAAFIEAAEIIRNRMPLYTEPQALNACRECISSIESAARQDRGGEE